jgi:hypothetical protein
MVPIAGMAFAGNLGIARVEVSTDGEATWKDARLKDALSAYTWVLWTVDLTISSDKHYKIVARATDKTGMVQTSEIADPFPNGAIGYRWQKFIKRTDDGPFNVKLNQSLLSEPAFFC